QHNSMEYCGVCSRFRPLDVSWTARSSLRFPCSTWNTLKFGLERDSTCWELFHLEHLRIGIGPGFSCSTWNNRLPGPIWESFQNETPIAACEFPTRKRPRQPLVFHRGGNF